MQLFMSGGVDVRKCSAKPSKEIYQASCVDAILTFLLGGNDVAKLQDTKSLKSNVKYRQYFFLTK